MKCVSKILGVLCLFIFLISSNACSRKVMDPASGKMVSAAKVRKVEKKRWKEQRRMQRLEERKIRKHHERIQTSNTRKAMKRHKSEANQFNSGRKKFFLLRWFQRN
jgi:hypothetical protein